MGRAIQNACISNCHESLHKTEFIEYFKKIRYGVLRNPHLKGRLQDQESFSHTKFENRYAKTLVPFLKPNIFAPEKNHVLEVGR